MSNNAKTGAGHKDRLQAMIISQPQRASLGYRLRDFMLNMMTLSLWGLLIAKTYVVLSDTNIVWQQYAKTALTVLVINFVVILLVIHLWASYERLIARWRLSARLKRSATHALSYHLPPDPSRWHGKWQEKWHADFQAHMSRMETNKLPAKTKNNV